MATKPQFHVNDDGEVGKCSAQSPESCPFAGNVGHHDSMEEAEVAFAKLMDKPQSLRKSNDFKGKLQAINQETSLERRVELQEQLGGAIFDKLQKRLGFELEGRVLSREELVRLEEETHRMVEEIAGPTGDFPRPIYGTRSKELLEAIKPIPNAILEGLKGTLYTETVPNATEDHAGLFFKGMRRCKVEATDRLSSQALEDAKEVPDGGLFLKKYSMVEHELLDPTSGFRAFVKEGDKEVVKARWVGVKPAQSGHFRKISDTATVYLNGKKVELQKPVYEMKDSLFMNVSIIGVKKKTGDKSLFLHEFVHYVQDTIPPGEELNFFFKVKEGVATPREDGVKVYQGFEDNDYMGTAGGGEFLPEATRGLFWPTAPEADYLYQKPSENFIRVRNWTMGYWLSLNERLKK